MSAVGVSNYGPKTLRKVHAYLRYAVSVGLVTSIALFCIYTRSLLTLARTSVTRGCPWQQTRSSTPYSAGLSVLRSRRWCKNKNS